MSGERLVTDDRKCGTRMASPHWNSEGGLSEKYAKYKEIGKFR